MKKIFLDVNVFMYAAGKQHKYKTPCVKILTALENGDLEAVVNTEIFQELLYRYYYINLSDKGILLCQNILKYPVIILPVTEDDIKLSIELFNSYKTTGLKPRDCIHAATMKNNGITTIISADKDFDEIDFLKRIDPCNYKIKSRKSPPSS